MHREATPGILDQLESDGIIVIGGGDMQIAVARVQETFKNPQVMGCKLHKAVRNDYLLRYGETPTIAPTSRTITISAR
jgi:hypothetical protein